MARRMGFFARLFFTYKLFIRLVVLGALGWASYWLVGQTLTPITVGAVFPLTGPDAVLGTTARDGVRFAVAEINAKGGVLRRQIDLVALDGTSDPNKQRARTEHVMVDRGASVVFGCVRAYCRRTVYDEVSEHHGLFVYPYQVEGQSSATRSIELGELPNQSLRPGAQWAVERFGRRVFLVLPETLYGRVADPILHNALEGLRAEVVGVARLTSDLQSGVEAAQRIALTEPDVVLNAAFGDVNVSLYKTLDAIVPRDQRMPSLLFHASREEMEEIGWESFAGSYVMDSYFPESAAPVNAAFKAAYAREFGVNAQPDAQFEAAYTSVLVWAAAVRKARSTDPDDVLDALPGVKVQAPSGDVVLSHQSLHRLHVPQIAQIDARGSVRVIWQGEAPIEPQFWDPALTRDQWEQLLSDLHREWNNQWAPPS